MNIFMPEGSKSDPASPASRENLETASTSTEAGRTWPFQPPVASPEPARDPRSLRRGGRNHLVASAAVILAAAVAGLGVGHVALGSNSANTTAATLSLAQVEAKVDPGPSTWCRPSTMGKARQQAPASCSHPQVKS